MSDEDRIICDCCGEDYDEEEICEECGLCMNCCECEQDEEE